MDNDNKQERSLLFRLEYVQNELEYNMSKYKYPKRKNLQGETGKLSAY